MHQTHKPANQAPSCATINIKNLCLRTLIDFNPEERVKKQDVVLNIETHHSIHSILEKAS